MIRTAPKHHLALDLKAKERAGRVCQPSQREKRLQFIHTVSSRQVTQAS
jgi:hypothetical protein